MKYISVKDFQKSYPKILYTEGVLPVTITRKGVDIAVLTTVKEYGKGNIKEHLSSEGEDSWE